MSQQITIVQLEAVINRILKREAPCIDTLPPVLNALAETYGWMIHHRLSRIDSDALPEDCRADVLAQLGEARD